MLLRSNASGTLIHPAHATHNCELRDIVQESMTSAPTRAMMIRRPLRFQSLDVTSRISCRRIFSMPPALSETQA